MYFSGKEDKHEQGVGLLVHKDIVKSVIRIRKPTQPRIKFDLEKLNDPTVMSAFQATIGGRFAPLARISPSRRRSHD